jgi:hypothetical protein
MYLAVPVSRPQAATVDYNQVDLPQRLSCKHDLEQLALREVSYGRELSQLHSV